MSVESQKASEGLCTLPMADICLIVRSFFHHQIESDCTEQNEGRAAFEMFLYVNTKKHTEIPANLYLRLLLPFPFHLVMK